MASRYKSVAWLGYIVIAAPVSAYIRTLNEERLIYQVVQAAGQVANEVIVVDCGSSDRTVELAQQAGATIYGQRWLGYGKQKRFAEEHCHHNWLLSLDGDEIVSPKLAQEIVLLFAAGEPPRRIYRLRFITILPSGQPLKRFRNEYHSRLYDRRTITMPDHAFWDQFQVPPGEPVGTLRSPVLHHSFTGVDHLVAKWNATTSAQVRSVRLRPLPQVTLRIFLGLPVYFIKAYLVTGLVRSGRYGFVLAVITAVGRWLRDVKMFEQHMLNRSQTR